ncbi:serine/threonine protein kinase [Streptomyces sp. Ru73]|uniref:serine/threonine-protein kinase n=1 Tax=Streptomyces sp. Ru73 TaxID=2080748 RepID=UPI000CDCF3C0|nr:serine/threonine-protein kinase [Streptomyces sp. Ru73]POX38252.1 serine/threonine protein kinase [Streptomyces sp. Ru73]
MNGRVIAGRYELSALLGQGGMGQVWIAYDRRLDRRVGVKLLRPDRLAGAPDAEELRHRFARECRVTAQVDHPGLVTVHDAGSDGDDLYLVMQYVEGADLADHLAEHDPYPWPWAVCVAAQLCAVLASVHAVPIVHRDLKPRNVMVKADGTVTVLDLGIASALDTDTTRLTHTGSPIGSPAYMAPEQAMGGTVGPYTDLYALGVLLHELLSGSVPFAGSTALGVLHRHLYEQPVPVRQLRPDVPAELEALVLRLLAKDPEHRPADAQEVYQALAPLLPRAGAGREDGTGAEAAGGLPLPVAPMDPTRPFLLPHAPWPGRAAQPAGAARPAVTAVPVPAAGPDGTPGEAYLLAPPASTPPAPAPLAAAQAASAAPGPVPPGAAPPPPAPGVPVPVPVVPGAAPYPAAATPATGTDPRTPAPAGAPGGPDAPVAVDVAAAVDEVKRLLDHGRITRAVDILGGILPAAAARHGEHSPVVRTLRKQYAATLMDDGQYRRALPELRLLAEEFARDPGPHAARQALQFRFEAAQCLEALGEAAAALEEYRTLLPHFEAAPDDAVRPLEIRRSIGHLLLALGERGAAQETLARLLYDAERVHGAHHAFPAEVRRTLEWLARVR